MSFLECYYGGTHKIDLADLIIQYLWYQSKKNPERWFAFPDLEHALFPFGDWTHTDVLKIISRLIEEGVAEKNERLVFRWKGEKCSTI